MAESAVIGVPHPDFGEAVVAVVVPDGNAVLEPAGVIADLKGRVADFMLPRYVQFVTAIPKTETHKIQRNVLQKMTDGQIDVGA